MHIFISYLLLSSVLISYSGIRQYAGANMEVWVVKNNSSLRVDGKTNINSFECIVPKYGKTDTIHCEKQTGTGLVQIKSQLSIPIEFFDCHHKIMTKDLQKTLRMETYPYMVIDFKTFTKLPSDLADGTNLTGVADIMLAGSKKQYNIVFVCKVMNGQNIELTGTRVIYFSDFNLKPPSKLGGTIKVKDELAVEFKLQLKRTA